MRIISKATLKWKLLGGFLLCGLLTAISGGTGILSLRHVQGNMKATTKEIGVNIDHQNAQTRQLMPLRALVAFITNAKDEEELEEADNRLKQLRNAGTAEAREEQKDMLAGVDQLLKHKRTQLHASRELTALSKSNLDALEAVANLVATTSDDVEFDFAIRIDDARTEEGEDVEEIFGLTDMALSTVKAALTVRSYSNELNAKAKDALLATDVAAVDYAYTEITTIIGNIKSNLMGLPQDETTSTLDQTINTLPDLSKKMITAKKQMLAAEDELRQTSAEIMQKMNKLDNSMLVAAQEMKTNADETLETSTDVANRVQFFQILLGVGAVILALVVGFLVSASVTRPIGRIITGLRKGSDQVAGASEQVSSASEQLAEGSGEQAASLEETSSSLEEMAAMTRQNADNANQADSLMKDANRVVEQANDSMVQLTTSMEEISKASEETSKIIKTIDEIAFQTNLLALNAAVEAARAGEAGAGFAVVADEVRNLAMRAADAAKNTAALIEGTVNKVKSGSELVTKTNDAFEEVAQSASKVGALVAEIAAASDEQAQGIDRVNTTVSHMDKVVQGVAANAEESAAASVDMNAQAEQMKRVVQQLVNIVGGAEAGQLQPSQLETGQQQRLAVEGGTGTLQRAKLRARQAAEQAALTLKTTVHKRAPAKARKVRPDEVIPMDEDEFKDF